MSENGTMIANLSVASRASRTHRCRLYRTAVNVLPGEDFFTEVWDSAEVPITSSELPPESQLVASFSAQSATEVREEIDSYCQKHGYFLTGSLALQGSL
jgi:hypothetical protein